MKLRIIIIFLITIASACLSQDILATEKTPNTDSISISQLPFLDQIGTLEKIIDERIDLSNSSTNNIGNFADFKSIKIAWWSMWIAMASCLFTILIFAIQALINSKQGNDIKTERLENRFNILLNRYESRVQLFEIPNIGKGSKVFNFLFYEYKMLFELFSHKGFINMNTSLPMSPSDISSIAMSFVINGITSDNDGSENDMIYNHYKDILSIVDYNYMKEQIIHYREDLSSVNPTREPAKVRELNYLAQTYTLFTNYARYVLEGKTIHWFYGVRFYYIPIIKSLRNIAIFIEQNKKISDKFIQEDNFIRIIESMLTNSELGFLYAFVHSKENEKIELSETFVTKLIEKSDLPKLYICYEKN